MLHSRESNKGAYRQSLQIKSYEQAFRLPHCELVQIRARTPTVQFYLPHFELLRPSYGVSGVLVHKERWHAAPDHGPAYT